jgi:putative flippase GtrA
MINKLKSYLLLYFSKQFIYFILAGASAASINFFSRLILRNYFDIIASAIFAYSIALVFAFFLYRKLVFPFSVTSFKTQSIRFLLIQLSCMPIVILIFSILSTIMYKTGMGIYSEPVAHAISIGTPALITFLFYKLYVFYK